MEEDLTAIVIDHGSSTIKAGLASDDAPRSIFPSVVGRPRHASTTHGMGQKDSYVGNDAQEKREVLSLKYPIINGTFTNWDDMDRIWQHTFYNQIKIAPEEHPILLTSPIENNIEKMAQLIFELYMPPFIYIAMPAALSLLATGRKTGIVVDSGEDLTNIVPIYEGNVQSRAIRRIQCAGRELTRYLKSILTDRGYSFDKTSDEIVRDMKEKLCYVALDFEQEMAAASSSSDLEKSYELPDGQVVTIGKERFMCPEALFQPSLLDQVIEDVNRATTYSIASCDTNIHNDLFSNILLSGGNTMISGFAERVQKEITALAPTDTKVEVLAPQKRKYSAWKGGAIFASQPNFGEMCFSREDYEEQGSNFILQKYNKIID